MKKMKYIIIPLFAILLLSCGEDFLEEVDYTGTNSTTIFDSEDGFELMMNGAYVTLRAFYGKENFWDFTSSGTDIYTYGADSRGLTFCNYSGWNSGEAPDRILAMWRELYKSLNQNNLLLSKLDVVPFENPATRDIREGEIKFLRAHTLYWIVEVWGGVHLSTEYVDTEVKEAYRSSVDDFYEVIINDLNDAVNLLPLEQPSYGRINKPIAQAFLSKMYLTRGEYALAETYADHIINDYSFALVNTWTDIFDFEQMDNSEVVWPVVYSSDPTTTTANITDMTGEPYELYGLIQREGGHTAHLMFAVRYENTGWGMERNLPFHRGFQRFSPTRFFIDLFDETVDQRFYGSFKNHWTCNDPGSAPVWPSDDAGTPENEAVIYLDDGTTNDVPAELQGQPMFVEGDTSIKMLKHPVDPSMRARLSPDAKFGFHRDLGYLIFDINDMYNPDETVNFLANDRKYYFPIILKYSAPDRLEVSQMYSGRHAFAIRISDMYLVSAEAALMQANATKAYQRLETLANARAIDGNGAALLAAYGVNSSADIDIDFILDERARDVATEDCRFMDLKRTGKLQERIELYNPEAAENFKPHHALRPIPQIQLDAVTNKTEFYQNEGYN